MLRSSLFDCRDAYIIARGSITATNTEAAAAPNNGNKKLTFKSCTPFTNCINEINNKEINHAKTHWCSKANV